MEDKYFFLTPCVQNNAKIFFGNTRKYKKWTHMQHPNALISWLNELTLSCMTG